MRVPPIRSGCPGGWVGWAYRIPVSASPCIRRKRAVGRCGERRLSGYVAGDVDPSGGMVRVPLQIAAREVLLFEKLLDGLSFRIVSNAAQEPQRSIETMDMKGKIEGCPAQAPPLGKHVEQDFADGQNQTQHPFGNKSIILKNADR